jgi:hypothetical protein
MAVLCEAISVVIRRDSINTYYRGGWDKFFEAIPNQTFCTDGELIRIGFLNPNEVKVFVDAIVDSGLQFQADKKILGLFTKSRKINDIIIVDQHQGPLAPCSWVEFGKFKVGDSKSDVSMCWLFEGERIATGLHFNSKSMELATPEGWTPKDSSGLKFFTSPEKD